MENKQCVVILEPEKHKARSYAEWLMAATEVEALWRTSQTEGKFARWIDTLGATPDFELAALDILGRLSNRRSCVLELDCSLAEEFVMMTGTGLFIRDRNCYRPTPPFRLTREAFEAAIDAFASTRDEDYWLHPELLVRSVTIDEAGSIRARLHALDHFEDTVTCMGKA
jgi:hypothetical protein